MIKICEGFSRDSISYQFQDSCSRLQGNGFDIQIRDSIFLLTTLIQVYLYCSSLRETAEFLDSDGVLLNDLSQNCLRILKGYFSCPIQRISDFLERTVATDRDWVATIICLTLDYLEKDAMSRFRKGECSSFDL